MTNTKNITIKPPAHTIFKKMLFVSPKLCFFPPARQASLNAGDSEALAARILPLLTSIECSSAQIEFVAINYAAHKTPQVKRWLARHPRWMFHFNPTSGSWLNAVEGFFAKLSRRRLKRGVFRSIADLQAAINRFLAEHNQNPKPFIWRADPNAIIAARSRGFQTLESIH